MADRTPGPPSPPRSSTPWAPRPPPTCATGAWAWPHPPARGQGGEAGGARAGVRGGGRVVEGVSEAVWGVTGGVALQHVTLPTSNPLGIPAPQLIRMLSSRPGPTMNRQSALDGNGRGDRHELGRAKRTRRSREVAARARIDE